MEESEFNRLIRKYQQNLLSDEERAVVDEWLESFSMEKKDNQWSQADKDRLKGKLFAQIRGDKKAPSLGNAHIFGNPYAWRVAATLLLLVSLTYALWQVAPEEKTPKISTWEVSVSGGIKKILLSDGSIVWLKGNSTLSYPGSFAEDQRKVALTGEALFEVSPDASRPFIIQCGELITTVLGTSFNIKADEKNIEVVVLTGKVSLTSGKDPEGIIVLPKEKALYSRENNVLAKVEEKVDKVEAQKAVIGTEYPMHFEDTGMEEIIRRIEGKFSVEVHTVDDKIRNCVITADFTSQPLERTLDMIAQALGVEYEIGDGTVTITGEGCE